MFRYESDDMATHEAHSCYWADTVADAFDDLARFVVIHRLPGCLPAAEPAFFDDPDEAEQYIRTLRLNGEELFGRNDPHIYEVWDMNDA